MAPKSVRSRGPVHPVSARARSCGPDEHKELTCSRRNSVLPEGPLPGASARRTPSCPRPEMLAAAPSVGLGPDGQWDLTVTCPRCRAAPSSPRPRPSALRPPRLPSRPWARPSGAMPRAGPQCLPLRRASVYRGTQDEALVGPAAWLRKRPLLSTLWAEAAAVHPAPPRPGRRSRGLPLPPRPAGPTSPPALSAGLQGYFGCAPAGVNPLRRPCCPVPSTGARPAAKGDDLRGSAQPPPPDAPVTGETPWTLGRTEQAGEGRRGRVWARDHGEGQAARLLSFSGSPWRA